MPRRIKPQLHPHLCCEHDRDNLRQRRHCLSLPTTAGSLKKTKPSGSTRTAPPTTAPPRRVAPLLCGRPVRHRPHLWNEFPRQPHGLRRPGLHGAALVRRRPDHARYPPWQPDPRAAHPRGVRPGQRRLPARPELHGAPVPTSGGTTPVMPSSVHLDPTKRYYISILPGDAGNPFPAYTSAPNCFSHARLIPTAA